MNLIKIDAKEKRELLNAITTLQAFIENLEVDKSCESCMHFEPQTRGCEKFMQKPPEHIIKAGCLEWELFPAPPF